MSETSEPKTSKTESSAETAPAVPAAETPPPAPAAVADKKTAAKDVAVKSAPAGQAEAKYGWWWGTGRRKTAVARVRVRPGGGKMVVNKRPYDEYFTEERDRKNLLGVLSKTRTAGNVDVHVNVCGGGFTGQAGAIIQGLGRALLRYDPTLEPILRDNDYLTRDPRKVERKKYGQPGARKRFQFSKR
jgi:small subunit ribosomal protein S9